MEKKTECKIDSDGSVCFQDILNSFNSCVKEEHAWALCYQCAKYFKEIIHTKKRQCYVITEAKHVYLKVDGNIQDKTGFVIDAPSKLYRNEKEIVAGLGLIIYTILDPEIHSGDEILISKDLEQLITDMIADELNSSENHQETDDEGIERDSEESDEATTSRSTTHMNLEDVIKRCEDHLGTLTKVQVEAHFKAVVRALVAEALELSMFLEKVAQGTLNLPSSSSNSNLQQLQFSDWARFWVQVMGELRTGVKLKKVSFSKAPIEYELTPYEILMKDIRNYKYNLRKIMISGDIPSRVSKDAHAIILEFIRSRPPLKKVSDRKLPPQPHVLTPREQLLNSIKKGRKLRPVPVPRMSRNRIDSSKCSEETPITSKPTVRKLIKVDFTLFDDDDDDDVEETGDTPESSEPGLWSAESQISDATLEPYDLATQNYARYNLRRNTLDVVDTNLGCYSVPQSRPCSRQSCNSSETESVQLELEVARQMQDELISSKNWQELVSYDDKLSLTLSEIVHIRTVLTKAELDALPVEGKVRHDVEARKVCFLCLKTRFGIFGPWGQRCSLCKRTVCAKCCSRMNIPMEHFSSVPVVLLSPSIMCTPVEQTNDSLTRSFVNKITESDLNDYSQPGTSMESNGSEPASLKKLRSKAFAASRPTKMKGSEMAVCYDCKIMVLQIIKSARANRSAIRNKTIQNLTLNLSPVF